MRKLPMPFDGKNLCADSLRDDVFESCCWCADMTGRKGHLLGRVSVDVYTPDEIYFDGIVDVRWSDTSNTLRIELAACPCHEDFPSMREDFFRYYEGVFREWEQGLKENCVGSDSAEVEFTRDGNVLYVSFWWIEGN